MDDPILSVGYVLYRSRAGEREFLDSGCRVLNTDANERRISWDSSRGEYYSAIVAVRAALDYTNEPLLLHLDNEGVVQAIQQKHLDGFEPYFRHALYSFLPRFEDYVVQLVHRDNNQAAHEQARVGLRVGRDIQEGVL